jgi:diaminopimelate decarboxylase
MVNINKYKNKIIFAAKKYETPLYVIIEDVLNDYAQKIKKAAEKFNINIFFAIKSYPRKFIAKYLYKKFNFEIEAATFGELLLACSSIENKQYIIFNSNGKKEEEIAYALKKNVLYINCDSLDQFELILKTAEKNKKRAKVLLRYNPSINPKVHPYIATSLKDSKFGMFENDIREIIKNNQSKFVEISGIHIHLGSNIKDEKVYEEGFKKTKEFIETLPLKLKTINIGGGFGVSYKKEEEDINIDKIFSLSRKYFKDFQILAEPGRYIVAKAGVLVSRVLSVKKTPYKNFIVIDAGMTENIRPALYGAYHPIIPLYNYLKKKKYDIVGIICESSDFQAKEIIFNEPKIGDLIAILNTGAYSIAMNSNYNTRLKPPEVFLQKNGKFYVIKQRQKYKDIII